jgi:hypothetical protein
LSALLRTIDWARDFYLDYRSDTSMFGEQEMIYARPLYVGSAVQRLPRLASHSARHVREMQGYGLLMDHRAASR